MLKEAPPIRVRRIGDRRDRVGIRHGRLEYFAPHRDEPVAEIHEALIGTAAPDNICGCPQIVAVRSEVVRPEDPLVLEDLLRGEPGALLHPPALVLQFARAVRGANASSRLSDQFPELIGGHSRAGECIASKSETRRSIYHAGRGWTFLAC